jgi:pimeloyl-ACP methyl ester carboxylesterase
MLKKLKQGFATIQRRRTVILVVLAAVLVVGWALIPAIRAVSLVANASVRSAPPAVPSDLPVQTIHFQATDGVHLVGWLAVASAQAPTIILVHGSRGTRADMLPWARFLYQAGYNVFLFDERGCGQSDGWQITLGAKEPLDVLGAVRYLEGRADLLVKRFGALGISQGAGVVILAAAQEPALQAIVADSAWVDQQAQIARMGSVALGPFALPVLPYELPVVNTLIGADLRDVRPIAAIAHIAPRAVLLIHSADDRNTLTPLSGAQQLFAAAQPPKQEWIAPSGGHVGALAAHPGEYERQVLAFFATYLPPTAQKSKLQSATARATTRVRPYSVA